MNPGPLQPPSNLVNNQRPKGSPKGGLSGRNNTIRRERSHPEPSPSMKEAFALSNLSLESTDLPHKLLRLQPQAVSSSGFPPNENQDMLPTAPVRRVDSAVAKRFAFPLRGEGLLLATTCFLRASSSEHHDDTPSRSQESRCLRQKELSITGSLIPNEILRW